MDKLRQITCNRQELNMFMTTQKYDVAKAIDLILDKVDNLSLDQEYQSLKEIEKNLQQENPERECCYVLSHAYLNIQMAIVLMQMYAQKQPEFFEFFVTMLKPIISTQRAQKFEKNKGDKIPTILYHLRQAA